MSESAFSTITGSKPILLSAPHVYAHRRPRLSMSYKIGEPLTDIVVDEVCRETKSFGIVLSDESDRDFNYYKEKRNPYKKEIRKIVEENKIKYFVDIHGLKGDSQYDIAIYYPSRFSRSIQLARDIKEGLGKGQLKGLNILILRFPDDFQETISEFVADQLRVPSVQIEIARYIREKKKLRDSLVQNLNEILERLVI
jgi:hypothetical protein